MTTSLAPTAATAARPGGRDPRRVRASLLPAFGHAVPVATGRRYRGWSAAWVAFAAVAAVGALLGAPAWFQAATAGTLLPGGGLFAVGEPLLGAVALVLFAIAVFVWWAIGAVVLPPLVWLGAAVTAGLAAQAPVGNAALAAVAAVLPAIAGTAYATHRVRHRRQQRTGQAINARLATVTFPISDAHTVAGRPLVELSEDDLAFQRYAYDLALQPIDRFDGFVKLDQFREAALRYQLFFLGYTLSMAQHNSTPAFSGYLAEAQRNAIEKVLDRRVWSYWALENAWGRLSLRRDPVDTVGNVMFTGYYGTQLGMYESLNDARYSAPGALEFRWSADEVFAHDFGSVADSVIRNVEGTDFALYPCEPNWIYSICNTYAFGTLITHDRLHGSGLMERGAERLRHGYETEFLRPDGRVIGMRSKHLGLTWNFWTGAVLQMATALWLHPTMPEFAQRTWWLLRPELRIEDGLLRLPAAVSAKLDPGNYAFGNDHCAMSIAEVVAREMGDAEIAEAARRTLEASATVVREHGAAKYEGMSTFTSLYSLMARSMREGSLRDLVAFGAAKGPAEGPRLSRAAYPEVLVARAGTDGRALELVLRPGGRACRTQLEIDRLVPRAEYRVEGAVGAADAVLVADAEGRMELSVDLAGRTEVRLRPR